MVDPTADTAAAKRKPGSDDEEDDVPGKRMKAGPSAGAAEPAQTAKNADDDDDDDDFKPSRKRPAEEVLTASTEAASMDAASMEAAPAPPPEPAAELGTALSVYPEFECEHGCGFDGNLQDVEAHEKTCTFRPNDVDADGKPIKRPGDCIVENCQEKLTQWDKRKK